jgi:hypothetical protein
MPDIWDGIDAMLQRRLSAELQYQMQHSNGGKSMGDKGKKDKGQREKQKEPKLSLKQKRQAKKEKARNRSSSLI